MSFKKILSLSTLILALLFIAESATAQKRGKKKRTNRTAQEEKEPEASFKDNLVYEIGVGNPTFFGANGTSQFNIALKPGVAYKIVSPLTFGAFIKGDYTFANILGQEFSLLDYGAGVFTRLKIIDIIYLRGELTYQNYAWNRQTQTQLREDFVEPLLGLGYTQGLDDWKIGGELLIHMKKDVRDHAGQVYEFWLKANYKF